LGYVGLTVLFVVLFTLNIEGLRERLVHRSTPPAIRSLAVLPLANLSGDTSQDFFADGMTAELIREVSKIAQLSCGFSNVCDELQRNAHAAPADCARVKGETHYWKAPLHDRGIRCGSQ